MKAGLGIQKDLQEERNHPAPRERFRVQVALPRLALRRQLREHGQLDGCAASGCASMLQEQVVQEPLQLSGIAAQGCSEDR